MIQPTLISFAKLNQFTDIIVRPIGKQKEILEKFYNYKRELFKFEYPCDIIRSVDYNAEESGLRYTPVHRLRL